MKTLQISVFAAVFALSAGGVVANDSMATVGAGGLVFEGSAG